MDKNNIFTRLKLQSCYEDVPERVSAKELFLRNENSVAWIWIQKLTKTRLSFEAFFFSIQPLVLFRMSVPNKIYRSFFFVRK